MSSIDVIIETEIIQASKLFNPTTIRNALDDLSISKGVIYYIVTDEELIEVNKTQLNHDTYTDIITFDYSDDDDIEHHEILISWDRIIDNAKTYKQTVEQEFYRVCFHGLLHISGLQDKTDKENEKMRSEETRLIDLCCST